MLEKIKIAAITISCMLYGCLTGYLLSQLFGIRINILILIFSIVGYYVAKRIYTI